MSSDYSEWHDSVVDSGRDPAGVPDDFDWPEEGDCPDCDGTGEVCCSCGGGCGCCVDGYRTCLGCDGSGFRPVEPPGEDD